MPGTPINMHIKTLRSNRLKQDLQLEPVTVVTGPNFSGKTTILNLIRAGVLGYVPELGKTNGKTFEIAEGPQLNVELKLAIDYGTATFSRSWESKRGSIAKVDKGIPAWIKDPITLNAREYFDLTPAEKVKFIFKHVDLPETLDVGGIIQRLNSLEVDADSKQILSEAITEHVEDHLKSADPEQLADRIAELLDEKKGVIADEYRYHKKRAKDTEGTMRVLTELKNRAATFSSESLEDLSTCRDKIKVKLVKLNETIARLGSEEKAHNAQRQILIGHKAKADAQLESLESLEYYSAKIEAVGARLKEAESELEKVRGLNLDARSKKLNAERDKLNGEVRSLKTILDRCRADYGETSLKIKEIEQTECCPHCKSSQDGWRKHLLESLQTQLDAFKKDGEAAKATAEKLVKEVKLVDERISEISKQKEQLVDRERVVLKLKGDIEHLEKDKAARVNAEKLIEGLQIPDVVDHSKFIAASQEEITKLEAEQQEVQGKIEAEQKLRHELTRAQEAETEHLEAEQKTKVFELIGKELRSIQKELIDTMFNGLLADINWFTNGLLDHKIEYNEGELGYFKKGQFITHRTFSGTESTILYAAASVALSAKGDFKIVMLDEFDIEPERMNVLLDRFQKAIDDNRLDQAIIAHTGMENATAHVINLGK